ncbi:MAG: transcriptional regulator [Candidatus Viridilinea halotolerans]|uniref:Transcriptional regulator n=1 Tax=Candidatus Viridilinea halotolerans TaxID=2491704 RepID=A0A426TXG7_9CHLR|nr:MAG: transcriptional regulator [Candidatus Viridilinea halotolerans]
MLAIRLLGPPQILDATGPVALPRRQARALLFYLAAQGGPITREQLLRLLWADHERPRAQQLLRTTLHAIRRTIGPVLQGDDALQIDPAVAVDYRSLQALVVAPAPDESALAALLTAAHGDFMADFTLPAAEEFAHWLDGERERAHLLCIRGATHLAHVAAARHDYHAAWSALELALQRDPLQEDLQREAMRFHYLAGDRVGAIRRYEQLRERLEAELGVPPMRETQAIYDALILDALSLPTVAHGLKADRLRQPRAEGEGHPTPPQDLAVAGRAHILLTPQPPAEEGERMLQPVPVPVPVPSQSAAKHALMNPEAQTLNPESIPFTGRSAELAQLEQALAAGRLALIEGEPGIGKTRLALELLRRAEAAGALVLVGNGRELEQKLPYQALVGALRTLVTAAIWPALRNALDLEAIWLQEAARLLPELAPSSLEFVPSGQAEEVRLWEGVTRLLLALSARAPFYLVLDDAHWADASSLGLLAYLLRRAAGHPLRLLLTTRPLEAHSPVATLVTTLTREGRVERIALQGLTPAASMALAQQICPTDPAPLAAWLHHNAEGNPYIIGELLRYAREQELLSDDGQLQLPSDNKLVVPHTVYSLIAARLVRLSDAARRVLDAAVAVGRTFTFALVQRAAALAEGTALDALDELRAARLVTVQPDGSFSFDHSLTMEVAYRQAGLPRHQALQRRVAEALEVLHSHDRDAVAGLIATHFAAGGAHERAATYALCAGERAAAVAAWAEAVAFYEQALNGTPATQRFALLLALGEALHQRGASPQAAARLHEALACASDARENNRARLSLASVLVPLARYDDVIGLVRDVARSGTPHEQARALFRWGTALSLAGTKLPEAALRLREAERILANLVPPDPVALAQVYFELGGVAAQQGDLPRAIATYQEALTVADGLNDPHLHTLDGALTWRILARNNLAYHLLLMGDLAAATCHAEAGLALASQHGVLGLLPYLHSTAGEIALAQGALAPAETSFQTGLTLAEQLSLPERIAGLGANLGRVACARGERTQARARLQSALSLADSIGTHYLAAQIRIWLAPLLPPDAAQATREAARAIATSGGYRRLLEELEMASPSSIRGLWSA